MQKLGGSVGFEPRNYSLVQLSSHQVCARQCCALIFRTELTSSRLTIKTGIQKMRNCLFCEDVLSNSNRAKEHVLRHSWLKNLGYATLPMNSIQRGRAGITSSRILQANQLLAGEVCKNCNNGWMDNLDRQVEHIVFKLANESGENEKIDINKKDARTIGRWLLKVACVHECTDSKDRRHIPQSVRSRVMIDKFLPPGFIAIACRNPSDFGEVGVEIVGLDAWTEPDIALNFPQSTRLKFAIRYNNITFGCCYVHSRRPTFIGIRGLHHPLITSKASFRFKETVDAQSIINSLPQFFGRENTLAEIFLATIGVV